MWIPRISPKKTVGTSSNSAVPSDPIVVLVVFLFEFFEVIRLTIDVSVERLNYSELGHKDIVSLEARRSDSELTCCAHRHKVVHSNVFVSCMACSAP